MYPHVVRFVQETPWAVLPATLDAIIEVVKVRAGGDRFTPDEIAARIGARRSEPVAPVRAGDIAVLPLYGVLSQRMNMMTEMSGGTSTEKFGAAFQQAAADPGVGVIVLDVDSPGGSVFGVQELADVLAAHRSGKPVVAVANSLMASAAYWVASQADEVVVTPSGQVGSIGVMRIHEDLSKLAEQKGITVSYITAGAFKGEGEAFRPLTDEARAAMQKAVDAYYGQFVRAVARGRSVTPEAVRDGFGQGRVVGAAEAMRQGMVDRIGTLAETIARLQKPGAMVELRSAARLRHLEAMAPGAGLRRRRARMAALLAAPRVAPEPPARKPVPAAVPIEPSRPTGLPGHWRESS